MKVIKILASLVAVIMTLGGAVHTWAMDDTEPQGQEIEKPAKRKLTKEEKKLQKQKIKELNAIVKNAKRRMTKEEKARIEKLTILEQDLRDWLLDFNAIWYSYGSVPMIILTPEDIASGSYKIVELGKEASPSYSMGRAVRPGEKTTADFSDANSGSPMLSGNLYVKNGATLHARMFYRGITYDCVHVNNVPGYSWHFRDEHSTRYYFNIPGYETIPFYHPRYKDYNPWEKLIELEKKNGIMPKGPYKSTSTSQE